jgi:hypothetical protein
MEASGMNPRRAYWANALSDMGNMARGGADQNTRMQGNMAQQQHQRAMQQEAFMRAYKSQMANAAILNAQKRPDTRSVAEKMAEAAGHKRGTPEYQAFIKAYASKPGMTVNMGPKVGTEYYKGILKNLPEQEIAAQAGMQDIAKYNAMEALLPHIGNTGIGKEFVTHFRSALNQYGMSGVANALDIVTDSFGIDLFSGDVGAIEAFKALGTDDIVGRAKELYPVSNSDINLLKEMVANLRISDPDTQRMLIQTGRQKAQSPIDIFNRNRKIINEGAPDEIRQYLPTIPGLPANPAIDVKGVTGDDPWEEEMKAKYGDDWRDR